MADLNFATSDSSAASKASPTRGNASPSASQPARPIEESDPLEQVGVAKQGGKQGDAQKEDREIEWGVGIQRGPSWLFVRLKPGQCEPDDIAERVWSAADRHFIYRLVLEMDEVEMLPSRLMGQLVMLQKRALQNDGALRLSGLKDQCAHALQFCRLDKALPCFPSREEAVAGERRVRVAPLEAYQTSYGM